MLGRVAGKFLAGGSSLPADPLDDHIGVFFNHRCATDGGDVAKWSGVIRVFHHNNRFFQLTHGVASVLFLIDLLNVGECIAAIFDLYHFGAVVVDGVMPPGVDPNSPIAEFRNSLCDFFLVSIKLAYLPP